MQNIYDISINLNEKTVVFPGDAKVNIEEVMQIEKGQSCNVSKISLGSHTGTHIDVPRHFYNEGKSIEDINVDRFIGKAKVYDMQGKSIIRKGDLTGLDIQAGDFILFKTDNSSKLSNPNFYENFVYLTEDGAEYLVEKDIGLVGIDYLSIEDYHSEGFRVHLLLLENEIFILEGIDLTQIKPGEYKLITLPLKIDGGNGSPVRAVLINENP